MILVRWERPKAKQIAQRFDWSAPRFISIDPGSTGAALVFDNGKPVASACFSHFSGYADMERLVAAYKIAFCVTEGAFVRANPQSAISLSFWRGWALRSCLAATSKLSALVVPPSTWQSSLPKDQIPLGHPWDGAAKKEATLLVYREHGKHPGMPSSSIKEDAVASAFGIGRWWLLEQEKYRAR